MNFLPTETRGGVFLYGLTNENTDLLPVVDEEATSNDGVSVSSERFENSLENEATFSPPQICSLNINSLITNGRSIKARKLLKDKLKKGHVIMLQDTRINSKEKFGLLHSWAKHNIKSNKRVFASKNNKSVGGVAFIFPEKHFKEIITINAHSDNLMYIVYSNLNEDIQLLINYYGRPNHTNASFSRDMNLIKQTVNNTRRIYSTATVVIAGDFNIKAGHSNKYLKLLQEMNDIGLSHILPRGKPTRFPFGKQNLTSKPSKIDYIFTSEKVRSIMEEGIEPHFLTNSDHAMLTLSRSTKKREKIPSFPDQVFENENRTKNLNKMIHDHLKYILVKNNEPTNEMDWPRMDNQLMDLVSRKKTSANEIISKLMKSIVQKMQKRNNNKKHLSKLAIKEMDVKMAEICKIIDKTECKSDAMKEFIKVKLELETERRLIVDKMEAEHNCKLQTNYFQNGDKSSAYHLGRNSNKKIGNGIEMIRTDQGKFLVKPDEIEKEIKEYFAKQFKTTKIDTTEISDDNLIFEGMPKIDDLNAEKIKGSPTKHETMKGIDALKDDSSPGPDGVTAKLVKHIFKLVPSLVTQLYFEFYNGIENRFNHRYIRVIEKPGKNSYLILKNHRPISLISSWIKGYENIIYSRLIFALTYDTKHEFDEFTEGNFAYRKNKSVHDCYRNLSDMMEQYRNDEDIQDLGEQLLVTSIDVSSAFDAIEHDFLYKYLEKTGIPIDIINALKFNYETITASIKNGSKECFRFTRGIPQGSALSGLIFTIMLSPIIRRIKSNSSMSWSLRFDAS